MSWHDRYGPIVRLAPGVCSISSPDRTVYSEQTRCTKSDFYSAFGPPGRSTLFAESDMKKHRRERKSLAPLFSTTAIVEKYSGGIDDCNKLFLQQLDRYDDKIIDMKHWLECWAGDIGSQVTFGKRIGFLDEREDVGHLLRAKASVLRYGSIVGIYPRIHPYVHALMAWWRGSKPIWLAYVLEFTKSRMAELQYQKHDLDGSNKDSTTGCLLGGMLAVHEKVSDHASIGGMRTDPLVFVFAGLGGLATTMSTTLFYLYQHPQCLSKLRQEMDTAGREGHSGIKSASHQLFTYKHGINMPYLDAVIKESARISPPNGAPLWRVLPEEGAIVHGHFLPGGSVVGSNLWVAHYNKNVYGADVQDFRPERWIQPPGEALSHMNQNLMMFGLGPRTCLGKNLACLEVSKLLSVVVRRFDLQPIHPTLEIESDFVAKARNHEVLVSRIAEKLRTSCE